MSRNDLTPYEIELRKKFSNNLNELLIKSGKKKTDVHNHTKIPKSTLAGYFNGSSLANPSNIQKLADYFNVNKSELDERFNTKNKSQEEENETLRQINRKASHLSPDEQKRALKLFEALFEDEFSDDDKK